MLCPKCGQEAAENRAFCAGCGAPLAQAATQGRISPKSRLATTLLAWFLGYFGAHRFYVGKTGSAMVMLILGIVGIPLCLVLVGIPIVIGVSVWRLVDFIIAVTGNMRDKDGLLIEKW